jgi:hypothetical protein
LATIGRVVVVSETADISAPISARLCWQGLNPKQEETGSAEKDGSGEKANGGGFVRHCPDS